MTRLQLGRKSANRTTPLGVHLDTATIPERGHSCPQRLRGHLRAWEQVETRHVSTACCGQECPRSGGSVKMDPQACLVAESSLHSTPAKLHSGNYKKTR